MWEDSQYCWVVFCKNRWFHLRRNIFYRHRITLAETDAVAPLPPPGDCFTVRCDVCKRDNLYSSSDILRYEQEVPEPFTHHPLFGEEQV